MNAITLTVPLAALIQRFELPAGQVTGVRQEGEDLKLVFASAEIHTPFDFPLDYEAWRKPSPESKGAVSAATGPETAGPAGSEIPVGAVESVAVGEPVAPEGPDAAAPLAPAGRQSRFVRRKRFA